MLVMLCIGSPCVLLMSIINPDGIELIGRVLFCLLWRKCGMDKPFGKLGPSSSSSCSTLSPSFDYHCTPQIITSTQTSVPKVHYYYLKLLLLAQAWASEPGELTSIAKASENPFSIQSKSLSPHVSYCRASLTFTCLYSLFSNLLSVG